MRCLSWNGAFQIHLDVCNIIVFSQKSAWLAVGFLNGNKWDWSGDHERPKLISPSHNDIYLPSIGQRRLSWPDSVSVLVNSSTHGSVSVSAHIKILINKIQELELRLNWKLTLSTRSLGSKLPLTRLDILIYVFLSGPSTSFWIETIKVLMEKRKSFKTKSQQRAEIGQVRISKHFF